MNEKLYGVFWKKKKIKQLGMDGWIAQFPLVCSNQFYFMSKSRSKFKFCHQINYIKTKKGNAGIAQTRDIYSRFWSISPICSIARKKVLFLLLIVFSFSIFTYLNHRMYRYNTVLCVLEGWQIGMWQFTTLREVIMYGIPR